MPSDAQKVAEAFRNIEKRYSCTECEQEYGIDTNAVKHHIREHQEQGGDV